MFEDVDGMEVYVNPEKVIWVREYPNHTTVISCGKDDKFAVRLAPSHAVAALGKKVSGLPYTNRRSNAPKMYVPGDRSRLLVQEILLPRLPEFLEPFHPILRDSPW